jgi:hypothetical protein
MYHFRYTTWCKNEGVLISPHPYVIPDYRRVEIGVRCQSTVVDATILVPYEES